jgi:DNA modification methylase
VKNSENDPNREINGLDRSDNIKSTVICGDYRTILAGMASESVDNVRYFTTVRPSARFRARVANWTRDSYLDFIFEVTKVFDQVKRVLKPNGTCWIVICDRWASGKRSHQIRDSRWTRHIKVPRKMAASKARKVDARKQQKTSSC